MSLIGGGGSGAGGAGNPVGANPAGIGSGLNYIGNHCYAYSGTFPSSTSEYTILDFSTGGEYSLVKLTVSGATDNADPENGGVSVFTVTTNSQEVARIKVDASTEDSPTVEVIPLLLEPYSKVTVKVIDNVNVSTRKTCATIVGRVYS